MKRRNVLTAAVLVGLLIMASVTAAAQEKKVKPSKAAKTKKMRLSEAARFSPAMLLGKAKELELTESQQKQLVALMKEMQAKTSAVLTKAQAAKVKTWKPAPQPTKKMKMAAKGPDGTTSQSKKIVK